ncbi:hypothetical protein JRO89_XS14G0053000 [Xanthoceras sorbifolium]|uniref:Uncharacterized protein n=1 Tax=Xanthoceras sorbifolium TaxID=99658 RepID=A0ABQ8H3W9_9ROSI|nr:hypothetical protein JRO89_XS14G0053000 [Xanthoceras sorbifolium]
MGDSSASYIHMGLLTNSSFTTQFSAKKEEAVLMYYGFLSLSLYIYIYAVWNELEKENKEFFEAYAESQSKDNRMSEEETSEMIHKIISDSSKRPDGDDDDDDGDNNNNQDN